MNRSVKETATDPRDALSKYFAFHILPSNSPERQNLSPSDNVLCLGPKRSIYKKNWAQHAQTNYFV
jgi:hypothetical protein